MGSSLPKLTAIGGPALSSTTPNLPATLLELAEPVSDGLLSLLQRKNGFYAFESALHVFSIQPCSSEISLTEWNAPDLWIDAYQGLAKEASLWSSS
jgi:hypothetical protein